MDIVGILKNWVPTFFTVLFVVVCYMLVKFFFDRQNKATQSSVIRTISLFSIALIGFIFVILSVPMDESIKGQITNLFGIVISAGLALSSATFIGNGLAGVMLRAVNSYKAGDFIQVGEVMGRVSEKGLFHTEIQTENRDLVTLPNLHLATNPVRVIRASGTFVNATCSLGYDVNQNIIKEALIKAAESIGLEDSFVHITELGDFSVVYKVYGLLKDAKTIISARSRLHSAMLDHLHAANIEIVSPNFMNQRQVGDTIFIPKKVRKQDEVTEPEKVEELIFDKAEEAETIEKKSEDIEKINEQLKEMKVLLAKESDDVKKASLEDKLKRLEEIKTKMQARLDSKLQDQGNL